MKDLRIVFMGTPDFAVSSLDELLKSGYTIAGVVTAPDKPAGRGRKLQESPVKKYALDKGLPLLQPTNLKKREFLEELTQLGANLQVVVAFRMLPREVWAMPEYGTFNLHASLLPEYRGAAPINWAIINGETETGVTTFFIDDKIDTGAIILQERTTIAPDETAGMLHDRLMHLGARLVVKTAELIANDKAVPVPQPRNGADKMAPKIHKDNCRINWENPLLQIYNHIRGLCPYPAAWSVLINGEEEITVKLFLVKPILAKHTHAPGMLVPEKDSLKVAVHGGYLDILEMQLAGKRRLPVKEVLNGLMLLKNAKMA